jgi:hypothetical protein
MKILLIVAIRLKKREVYVLSRQIKFLASLLFFALFFGVAHHSSAAVDESGDKSSSMQMMERVETIIYGEVGKGGLIDRLNTVEKELFGRGLPGSISERHSAILNFLEVGTADQPSMLFKMGVAEWIVGQNTHNQQAALKRVESMETELDGAMQYGKPLAMRVERILASLVADPVTFQEVLLPRATVLRVQFLEELGPAKTKKGDSVGLALTNDLLVDKVLVAPKGSLIDTTVRQVKQPGVFGTPSNIRFDFKSLMPLGPERPRIVYGEAAKKATEEAQKGKETGAGAIIGAGALSLGGAAVLGPVGLPLGFLIRGNAIKIPVGTIMFLETSDDVRVSGYPVPESLRISPSATIRESVAPATDTIELPAEQNIQ